MQLKPVENDNIKTIVRWMMDEQNYRWLDFGRGVQKLTAPALKRMTHENAHELRIFTSDEADKPIGLISLSDINKKFKTATLWFVLGDKKYTGQNYTTKAVSSMLTMGFEELKLESIFAWAVEKNISSIKVLEKTISNLSENEEHVTILMAMHTTDCNTIFLQENTICYRINQPVIICSPKE